jgi:superfamily II DNA/RNA helicase
MYIGMKIVIIMSVLSLSLSLSLSVGGGHVCIGTIKIIIFGIRVGRTARAGREGVSVSLYGEEDRSLMKIVMKNTTNITVSKRSVAYDIIEKYNKKLQSLEPDVEQILEDERNAKKLSEVEGNVKLIFLKDRCSLS